MSTQMEQVPVGQAVPVAQAAAPTVVVMQQAPAQQQQLGNLAAWTPGPNDWDASGTFGCFSDVGSCIYVCCCPCCAICNIGDKLQHYPVGPKNEPANSFMSCGGQYTQWLTYAGVDCCCLGLIIGCMSCPEKTWCNYDKNVLEAVAKFKGKNALSPGPCNDPLMQMCCCQICTYCLLYREVIVYEGKGGGGPDASPEMER